MKILGFISTFIITCLLYPFDSIAQEKHKIDIIIEMNKVLVNGDITNVHLKLNNGTKTIIINADYIPGHLIVNRTDFLMIDTAKSFTLCFDHYTYNRDKFKITNFEVDMSHSLLTQAYLVLFCFDFHDKRYRRLYESSIHKDFVAVLDFPGSGLVIPEKKGYPIFYFNE